MDPLHSNPTSNSTSSGKMGGKQPHKFNFLKRIWNGLTDLLASKGLTQRNIKHLTSKEGVTGAVDRLSQKVMTPGKPEKLAENHAKEAIKDLEKLAKKNRKAPWVKHMPAIKETIRIAADLSEKTSTVEQGNQTELTVEVGKKTDLVLHAIDTGDELKIVGLFGKTLGQGDFGKTTHLINFLSGTFSEPDQTNGVMKEFLVAESNPMETLEAEQTLKHEIKINQHLAEKLKEKPPEVQRFFSPGYQVIDPVTQKLRLLMPYAKGQNLHDYYDTKKPPLETKLKIANQMILAAKYLHEMGIYHLDLKLGNFMIDFDDKGDFQLKLIDFGGSQALDLIDESQYQGVGWLGNYLPGHSPDYTSYAFNDYETLMLTGGEKDKTQLTECMNHVDQQSLAIKIKEFLTLTPANKPKPGTSMRYQDDQDGLKELQSAKGSLLIQTISEKYDDDQFWNLKL